MVNVVAVGALLLGCAPNDPCDENPASLFCDDASDDTGGDDSGDDGGNPYCAPNIPLESGYVYDCQGTGNGWLELSVNPLGPLPLQCVNWGEKPQPDKPTSEDCVALDFTELPSGIRSPGACCIDDAKQPHVVDQCGNDCAFAACKLVIQKLRDGALSLPTEGAKGVLRLDLFFLANMLETPNFLADCAKEVHKGNGEPVAVVLGAGKSSKSALGHINDLTVHLQCAVDGTVPYQSNGSACEGSPNIPLVEAESNMGGGAATGSVAILEHDGNVSTGLYDIEFAFTQTRDRNGTNSFELERFTAKAESTSFAGVTLTDPTVRLVATAHGSLVGETVSFPPGSLRMEVTAGVGVDGEQLFDGERVSGEFVNSGLAIATRLADDTFSFIEAPFEAGGYPLILSSAAGGFQPR